jgi:uncharacterized membrane protein
MSLVFLSLAIAALWINLLGAGLVAKPWVEDYSVSRVVGVLALCLAGFFLEHFFGFGPHLVLLPFTSLASIWLIWRNRQLVRANIAREVVFAAGFFYCFLWRFTFPDIDFTEDKMPNFGLIESYMRGVRLPGPDLWFSPFPANCYYSFQHYCAAFLGRLIGVGPGVSYHLAFCVMVGFMALLMCSCIARLCPWRPGRWLVVTSLFFGGCGIAAVVHLLVKEAYVLDVVRFVGGSIVHNQLTPLGNRVSNMITTPGMEARDLPMEPFSYYLTKGDFHPPLAGFLLLALAAALIASQESGASGRRRAVNHALLAATMPIALISNAWIVPLQCLLVAGYFIFCSLRGELRCWRPAFAGFAVALALEYPSLLEFTQQAIGDNAALGLTASEDHTPWLAWLIVWWPALGILVLGFLSRERRPLILFFIAVWSVALIATEFLYNHDLYGGAWSRFNSALKWWQWVYAAIVLTSGALNLGSRSRVCRYGTVLMLLPTLVFVYDLARQYIYVPKPAIGHLSGASWIERDVVIRDMIMELKSRPEGVAIESGLVMANSESPAVSLFSDKQSYLGWPWLEQAWRGNFLEVNQRLIQMNAFYAATLPHPLEWLLHNNIKYVLWLPRDNLGDNQNFKPDMDQIKSRYFWHHMYGNDQNFAVGFWERIDPPGPAH